MIFKFNSGAGAVLCNTCKTIICTGLYSSKKIPDHLPYKNNDNHYFCSDKCLKAWPTSARNPRNKKIKIKKVEK